MTRILPAILVFAALGCGAAVEPEPAQTPTAEVEPTPAPTPRERRRDPPKTPKYPLELRAAGSEPATVGLPDLAFVPTYAVRKRVGNSSKECWSLVDIVELNFGEGARAVAITTKTGARHEVPPERWNDAWWPAIKVSGGGEWRLLWADPAGFRHPDDSGLRRVTAVEVVLGE